METDQTGVVLGKGCGKTAPVNLVWTYLIFKYMKIHRLKTLLNVLKYQQGWNKAKNEATGLADCKTFMSFMEFFLIKYYLVKWKYFEKTAS